MAMEVCNHTETDSFWLCYLMLIWCSVGSLLDTTKQFECLMFIGLVEILRNTLWLKGVKVQLVSESNVLSSSYLQNIIWFLLEFLVWNREMRWCWLHLHVTLFVCLRVLKEKRKKLLVHHMTKKLLPPSHKLVANMDVSIHLKLV
jgi:hypothetical protein